MMAKSRGLGRILLPELLPEVLIEEGYHRSPFSLSQSIVILDTAQLSQQKAGVQGEEEETVISHFDRWSLAPPPSILPRITESIGTSFSN